MPSVEDQIRIRIESFVSELTDLVRAAALEAVGDALGTGGVAAPARRGRPPGRKNAATGKKRGRPRSKAAVDPTPVLAYISANPDLSVSDIAAGMGTDSNSIKPAIAELLENGAITKTGQKRGTKYQPAGAGGGGGRKKAARKAGRKKAGRRKKKSSRRKTSSKAVATA
jgi:hypothetical protein